MSRGSPGARKYARADYYARAAQVIAPTPAPAAPALAIGDEVYDVAIHAATGRRVVGTVVKLHKVDGEPHALVRGGPVDQRWLAHHSVARFRRAGGGS